jgi:hypothetical protein
MFHGYGEKFSNKRERARERERERERERGVVHIALEIDELGN